MPKTKINETLFGKLITSYGLKITDLEKHFDVSKTTIRNYRMKDNLDAIPQEKRQELFDLFGVKNLNELKELPNLKDKSQQKAAIIKRLSEEKKTVVRSEDNLVSMYIKLIEKKIDVLKVKIKNEDQALKLLNDLSKIKV